jgi:exodeoxyribonuclease VII small subunit
VAEPKFEKDLEKLEEIVDALEAGGLPLDQSLKKFEEGIKLAQRCEKALTAAEKRIEILTKKAGGDLEAQPFGDESESEDDAESESSGDADDEDEEDGELLF